MIAIEPEAITGREFHPVLRSQLAEPLWSTLSQAEKDQFYALRRDMLIAEVSDRYHFGYRLPVWQMADKELTELRNDFPNGVIQLAILGANRSSKTSFGTDFSMRQLVTKGGARGWCLQATQATSRADQQGPLFWQIPAEWRPASGKLRGGASTKIVWSQAGGFTEDTFVLPNRSQCWFKFYTMNVGTVEGAELDFAWVDELVTPDWIEALRFRLITRAGILLLTFTPVEGYSPTVKEFLENAITIQEVDAELLPIRNAKEEVIGYEKVPRLQISRIKTARIIYFHTADNPYGNYDAMKTELGDSSRDRILMRAYGVATNTILTQFPGWRDMVHIISVNKWREIEKLGGTRLHFVDPCSGRNWFMIWVLIDALNRAFIYREWPSTGHFGAYIPGFGDLGEWAVMGKAADGDRGPAQRELGWGLKRYIEEIYRSENYGTNGTTNEGIEESKLGTNRSGEPAKQSGSSSSAERSDGGTSRPAATAEVIFERWMDGRYGNATKTSTEESVTLIDEMSELGMDFLAAPSEVSVELSRRGGGEALRLINSALDYNKEQPIDFSNQPHLYVLETCPNTIYALKNWTGQDRQHGACKDPIDCLRMMVLCGSGYCDEEMLRPVRPFSGAKR
jgi:hypothetical protein